MEPTRGAATPAPAPRAPSADEVMARADALDQRRRLQVEEQRLVINRILRGETLTDEFIRQQNELVEVKARQQAVIDELVSAGRKPSPVARRVLAILDPQDPPPAL